MNNAEHIPPGMARLGLAMAIVGLLGAGVACARVGAAWNLAEVGAAARGIGNGSSDGTPASAGAATQPAIVPLSVEPVNGSVGGLFTISAGGLQPGQQVELQWAGIDGAYSTKVIPDNVEYTERTYSAKRVPLGQAVADAQGRIFASAVPRFATMVVLPTPPFPETTPIIRVIAAPNKYP